MGQFKMDIPTTGYLLLEQSEFQANIVRSFQDIRTSGEFLDVTLACENETVEAHKVVISACSPFFRHVLATAKQAHPFIYLKGILHEDLVALLDYMYNGETKVAAEHVNRFIEAAQELKIKGLAFEEATEEKKESISKKEKKIEMTENTETITEIETYIKDEPIIDESDSNALIKAEISKRMERLKNEDGTRMWKCTECGKILKRKNHLMTHIEIHLEGFSHRCKFCEREFRTRNSLNQHRYSTHREKTEANSDT